MLLEQVNIISDADAIFYSILMVLEFTLLS